MDRAGPSHAPGSPRKPADASGAPERAGARRSLALWLVLALQLAIPASYYLMREDREDERFAWRMFSSLRFRSCQVQAFERTAEHDRPLTLAHALHASWVGTLRRGRARVIEQFLRSRCEDAGVESATLVRTCREVDGSLVPAQRYSYACNEGALSYQPERSAP